MNTTVAEPYRYRRYLFDPTGDETLGNIATAPEPPPVPDEKIFYFNRRK